MLFEKYDNQMSNWHDTLIFPQGRLALRLIYGSTLTQRKEVDGPVTSLWTLLASTARA